VDLSEINYKPLPTRFRVILRMWKLFGEVPPISASSAPFERGEPSANKAASTWCGFISTRAVGAARTRSVQQLHLTSDSLREAASLRVSLLGLRSRSRRLRLQFELMFHRR
jgi:hypothetical protein